MKNTTTPATATNPTFTLNIKVPRRKTKVFKTPPSTRTSSIGTHCSAWERLDVAILVSLPSEKSEKKPMGTLFIFSPISILLWAAIKYPACVCAICDDFCVIIFPTRDITNIPRQIKIAL